MAFFPRSFVSSDPTTSFTPLFRLLDDFDTYSRGSGTQNQHHHLKSFQPRFDVKELPDAYELHGEFPGIEQKDVDIEFTDAQTITIRGRTKRTYDSSKIPAALENSGKASAITENGNQSHQPTREDKDSTSITTQNKTNQKALTQAQPKEPVEKFWVSERSVGEFSRSFSFPTRVDQNAVNASMKNGILSIFVPKAKKHESRKITIT